MTISDQDLKHGMVIRSLLLALNVLPQGYSYRLTLGEESRSAYELVFLNHEGIEVFRFGLFIKTSAARRSPWGFTFSFLHQLEINVMRDRCADVFLVLVAGDDGVACLNYSQLKEILDENFEDAEWVSLSRKHNESYRVSGRDGALGNALARNSFPGSISARAEELLSEAK